MRSYSSEGVILARRNLGEADRILVLFTKDYGRVSLLAKGVRRPQSRKRGHLEVFNHIKFYAIKGRGIDLVTEAEIIEGFGKIRGDLKKVAVAYFMAEVVGKITKELQVQKELFDLLLYYLRRLENSVLLRQLRNEFTRKVLTLVGFWPPNKKMDNPDYILEEIIEHKISSIRVGKKISS